MGDVFRGGNQNVIATIDSKKDKHSRIYDLFKQFKFNKDQIKRFSKIKSNERNFV